MFVPLHNNLYICKHSNMHYSAVVLNVKEEGHDVSKIFFGKDDVLDFQPFSSFYLIRGDNLGMDYPSDPFTLQQEIDCFNALIDSGEIELYRFDLGY